MTTGINRPINAAATINAALTVPSTRPANAAAAMAPSASRTRSQAGTEQRRDHGVAPESQQPRGKRARGNGEKGTDHKGFYSIMIRLNRLMISSLCLSMIFSENRFPLFRIMLWRRLLAQG